MVSCARMAIALTILPGRHVLDTKPGTTVLKAAHAGGVDITATCGGRGRCTSCRVKLVAGTAPPACAAFRTVVPGFVSRT